MINILAIQNKSLMLPFIVMVIILLMSPAIQLNMSIKKNKYVGLIFPVIVFIFFLIFTIFLRPPVLVAILMTVGAPAALVGFHIIIRRNLRY